MILPKANTVKDDTGIDPKLNDLPEVTRALTGLPADPITDLPVDSNTEPKNETVTIEILKSQLESLQSTVDILVADVEVLKTPVTRVLTDDETEAKRIEETFERLFKTKKNEAVPILVMDEKTKQLNKANETISKYFGLNV